MASINPTSIPKAPATEVRKVGSKSTLGSRSREPPMKTTGPLFRAPWKHPRVHEAGISNTVRHFNAGLQRRRVFVNGLRQLLVPVVICGIIAGVIFRFSTFTTGLTQIQKYVFNALALGLTLCLGFASAHGLKKYALVMRWRFLAERYHTIKEFDLIMGWHSQINVARMIWAARTPGHFFPNRVQTIAFLYIFIVLALQATVALLGLTFSIDPSEEFVQFEIGNVSIATLNVIGELKGVATDFVSQASAANDFGVASTTWSLLKDVDFSDQTAVSAIYSSSNNNSIWYDFNSQGQTGKTGPTTAVDSRWIYSNATCLELPIVNGSYANYTEGFQYQDQYGNSQHWHCLQDECTNFLSAIYYSNTSSSCGNRCSQIYVYNVGYPGNNPTVADPTAVASQFFVCNNSVSSVQNLPSPRKTNNVAAYDMPDLQARIMAGAIGWSGQPIPNSPLQYHSYPNVSYFGWTGIPVNSSEMDVQISQFSAGAIGSMDQNGPRTYVIGPTPKTAEVVNVKWWGVVTVLSIVPGVQFILLIFVVFWASGPVLKDESFLSAARLLRPVVEKLGDRGCALTGEEIAAALGNYRIVYGARGTGLPSRTWDHQDSGLLHLDIIEESEAVEKLEEYGWKPSHRMPEGRYDGLPSSENESDSETSAFLGQSSGVPRQRRMSL